MTLKEKLSSDMKEALRSKDSLRLNTIRSVIAAIKNQEIDLRKELQGDEVLSIVTREVKKRKEASALFEQGGRMDLVEKKIRSILFCWPICRSRPLKRSYVKESRK